MDRVSTLLAQFPGPVRLAASRPKGLALLAAAAVFTAVSIDWIIEPGSLHVIAGWFGAAFFGLCTIVFAVALVPGGSEIVLDRNGFTTRFAYRGQHWKWTDVGDFAVVDDDLVPLRTHVGFNDSRSRRLKAGEQSGELRWRDAVLSDSYGLTKGDCARLLSLWRQRALSAARAGK